MMFNKSFGTPFGGGATAFGTTSTFGQGSGFGSTGAFGTSSSFGTSNNTGGLFGNTQNKPGGLFGSSTFSQPATSTSTGFGFGTASGSSNSLFGSTNTGGSLFSQPNNAFSQSKPGSFGTFGTSTNTGGLFGTTSTSSNPFGGTTGSLFGSTGFGAAQTGTTIKFNPPNGNDTMVKAGVTTSINTKHQCITAMKEYENKSLEELRLEDYQAERKGPQNPIAGGTGVLFGTPTATSSTATGLFGASTANTGFSFGPSKTGFGTGAFGSGTGSLFGSQPSQPGTSLFNKPFGQVTTTPSTGFSFGSTNTLGQPNTSSIGLFGNTSASQSGGLFGSSTNTSTATAFGTGTGLFGATNTSFGNPAGQTMFGNKTTGFGTTTTSAPSFGTGTGLFGNKPSLTLGTNTNTSTFGFGSTGGSLFGNKPATGGLGTGLVTPFGSALGTGQTSLFGNNQPKIGSTLGSVGTFGNLGFNTSTTGLGFGTPQQAVALTDPNASAAQQTIIQQFFNTLTFYPYGDSPLFRNPLTDPKKKEERLKPTNPAAQLTLTTQNRYRLSLRPATRVRPKALTSSSSSKSQLFEGLDDDDPLFSKGSLVPRKSIKRLVLKNLNRSSLFSQMNRENDDLASPSEYPENGDRTIEEESGTQEIERDDEDSGVGKFYTNPIAKPIPHTPLGSQSFSLQDTINELGVRNIVRNGLEVSSEDASLGDDSLQEEREEEFDCNRPPHPAGIVLNRVGYYTIPSMDELARMTNENGECIVENFTIGRKGYGSVYFPGRINLTNLNLDDIVHFRRKEVIVYPDDNLKPTVGEELNRAAEVTLDGVWPTDKTTRTQITSPERLLQMNFEGRLEKSCLDQGAQFLEYRPETGSWVFQVPHFSKYGLKSADGEDDVPPPKTDAKKLKSASGTTSGQQQSPVQQMALNGKEVQNQDLLEQLGRVAELDSDMADITQEPPLDGMMEDDDSTDMTEKEFPADTEPLSTSHIAASLGINPHTLQVMKASLFADDDDSEYNQDQRFGKFSQETSSPRVLSGSQAGGLIYQRTKTGTFRQPQSQEVYGSRKAPCSLATEPSWSMFGSSFLRPPPTSEMPLRTVGARRQMGPVPLEKSVTLGKGKLLMDMALFMGRSFRVGWGPNWILTHSGEQLSATACCQSDSSLDVVGYGLLPRQPPVNQVSECPLKVFIEKLTIAEPEVEEEHLKLYQCPLEIEFKNSVVITDDPCPFIQPVHGVEALHEYADWITTVIKDLDTCDGTVRCWKLVWTLCEALWGRLCAPDIEVQSKYAEHLERRRAFSNWLSQSVKHKIEEEVALSKKENHLDAIYSYLTGNHISEACKLAQQCVDHRLSLLLSQAAGSQGIRELLSMQLVDWCNLQIDSHIQEERLRVYTLLSGKPVWQSSDGFINVCSGLDWKRCVAIHLWYMLSPTASIADALCKYEEAFLGDTQKYACAPLPPYLEDIGIEHQEPEDTGKSKKPLYDICFHLLKLYSDRHYDLQELLDPCTVTPDRLDYRLSWHLWNVLQALKYSHLSSQQQGLLHASYAAQLESRGLWEKAVFVLLHISDAHARERAVKEMLRLHCSLMEADESSKKERFLTEKLLIPVQWIHEAKAIRACQEGNKHKQALHLFKARHWNQCHKLVIQHLASDAIINESHDYLLSFLEGLAPPERSVLIQDWDSSGKVFLDYIRVLQTLQRMEQLDSQGYELEQLHTEVTSLCGRIQLIQCFTAKDRLAQSEMAKRVANILRIVLSLQRGGEGAPDSLHIPLHYLAPHIGRLPMPEDYALEELRNLTRSYLQELVIQ
ncbi:nuclear pore complex protein Nup98-Nup96 isoform X1 [Polypterus senegalus]|uniref:nuclear pore complex protein Nup98-Nup96 isoform X1 n=2 Tax=Polypterus senegalus TaxID=55291 RepID=UPI001962BFA5|nr:nuclear pore complex protein Nup98-Nup96 isoform X1 [Polypterus senegalus]XP_039601645.1 nuclear pore complex protein Nup98-Nup96 isoform X1 [Polypterus senegalus]XP_039601646.1 nuclear pore complex protein Nup98-Nup96 isoform X1 [Polypterus senegalus]